MLDAPRGSVPAERRADPSGGVVVSADVFCWDGGALGHHAAWGLDRAAAGGIPDCGANRGTASFRRHRLLESDRMVHPPSRQKTPRIGITSIQAPGLLPSVYVDDAIFSPPPADGVCIR